MCVCGCMCMPVCVCVCVCLFIYISSPGPNTGAVIVCLMTRDTLSSYLVLQLFTDDWTEVFPGDNNLHEELQSCGSMVKVISTHRKVLGSKLFTASYWTSVRELARTNIRTYSDTHAQIRTHVLKRARTSVSVS